MSRNMYCCVAAASVIALALLVAARSDAQTITDPSWGYSFTLPAGWKEQHAWDAAVLGHDRIAGMILVLPHRLPGLEAVREEMSTGLTDEDVELRLTGRLREAGRDTNLWWTEPLRWQTTNEKEALFTNGNWHGLRCIREENLIGRQ